ncbi:hypothetical protein UZ36_05015 [Candidatus Nitromaritima sp. SCGC AAA799-C22]|nr:hypothetical protein UZ36_05015 [Candidatus Nitromaritima sp. SCGC AAA799-C22]
MLIFKNNIYDRQEMGFTVHSATPDIEYDELLNPLHLLEVALEEENELLDFLERQPREYWNEDLKKFYPHARKTGRLPIFRNLLRILKEGLDDRALWYDMNTYHFCFLYDILIRFAFNYNHDNRKERLLSLPELKGKPLHMESFIKDYFFNTVFLMTDEQYNSLTREEKLKKGYDCPCQFAVINALLPTRDEMELQSSRSYPYSIYV